MKISMKNIEIILIVILYLSALYIWTLPIQKNKLPFGDVDASSHFVIGDYMATYDKSIAKVPYPVFSRYGAQNSAFPGYFWYPPQYWTNTGIAQILGGERIIPVFIFVAIFSSMIVISSYYLIRNLFGFWTAFLSSFLLIFSVRDYMVYLWGQWPQSLSFAFTPLVLYSFYRYYQNYKENKNKAIYLYILSLFLAAQFFFHPQGLIASISALIAFNLILLVKYRKIPFNFKHAFIAFIIFTIISSLFAPFNVKDFLNSLLPSGQKEDKSIEIDKLFKWYQGIKNDPGLPDFYFTYNRTHGSLNGGVLSWWTLPLLLLGLFVLMSRRNDKDLLLLSWLVSFYFLTRLVIFGVGERDIRMFAYEAHVFYPIIAIGAMSINSFIPLKNAEKYGKYILVALFLILAVSINGKSAYETLGGMQYSVGRINPAQYEAAEWIRNNLPQNADIYDFGTLGYQYYGGKVKWLGVLSQRHFVVEDREINQTDYVFVDYSDVLLLKSQEYANLIQNFETSFQNLRPVYNNNNIRIYEVSGMKI